VVYLVLPTRGWAFRRGPASSARGSRSAAAHQLGKRNASPWCSYCSGRRISDLGTGAPPRTRFRKWKLTEGNSERPRIRKVQPAVGEWRRR